MQRNIWNPATCICENGKYLRRTIGDSVITCNGIIKATKTVQRKSSSTNFYILSVLVVVGICYCFI